MSVYNAAASTAAAGTPEGADDWVEFCDRHARASAADFAKAFCTYVSLNLPESARATLSHRDFLRKFIDSFCEHFESEYLRRSARSVVTCHPIMPLSSMLGRLFSFFYGTGELYQLRASSRIIHICRDLIDDLSVVLLCSSMMHFFLKLHHQHSCPLSYQLSRSNVLRNI